MIYLKGCERAIVSGASIGPDPKPVLGKLLRDGLEQLWVYPSVWVPPLTSQNCAHSYALPFEFCLNYAFSDKHCPCRTHFDRGCHRETHTKQVH